MAVDNAVSAAKAEGAHATLLFREAHWPVPRLLANLVPFKFGTYSRFGHFMLPTHYDETNTSWWFHSLLTPIKWGWWRIVEQLFKFQVPPRLRSLICTPQGCHAQQLSTCIPRNLPSRSHSLG